jgi:hypothetical protein
MEAVCHLACAAGSFRTTISQRFPQIRILSVLTNSSFQIAKAGEKDVLTEGLDLFADTALQIVVRMDGGVIGGSVRNSEGRISGAIVALIPEAPLRSAGVLYRSVISDFNGDFELRGIRPGAYRLFAWADMEGAAYRNTEFMKDYEGQGIRVRVENQVRQTIDVMAF